MCIISFEMERKCVSKKNYLFPIYLIHFLVSDQNENCLTIISSKKQTKLCLPVVTEAVIGSLLSVSRTELTVIS